MSGTGRRFEHYHHLVSDPAVLQLLNIINTTLERQIMPTIADISLAVQAQSTVVTGVAALLAHIEAELVAANEAEDPAAVQAVIDLIHSNTKVLADSVAANTVAAPETASLSTPVPSPPIGAPPPKPVDAPVDAAGHPVDAAGQPVDAAGQPVVLTHEDPNAPPHGETLTTGP